MSSSSEEVGVTSAFDETVSSVEDGELAIDDTVVENILNPDPAMAPDYDVPETKGALEELTVGVGSHADCVAEKTREGQTIFIEIMGSKERKAGGEKERFMPADILQRADLLSESLLQGVVYTSELPLC